MNMEIQPHSLFLEEIHIQNVLIFHTNRRKCHKKVVFHEIGDQWEKTMDLPLMIISE